MKITILCLDDELQTLYPLFHEVLGPFVDSGQIPKLQGGISPVFKVKGFDKEPVEIEFVSNEGGHPTEVIEEIKIFSNQREFDLVFVDDDWKAGGMFAGQDRLIDAVVANLRNFSNEIPLICYYTQHWEMRNRIEKFRQLLQNREQFINKISPLPKGERNLLFLLFQRVISEKRYQMDRDVALQRASDGEKRLKVLDANQLSDENCFCNIIGSSASMKQIYERIRLIGPSDSYVLLQGETGSGKQLIAKAIHQNSSRRNKNFRELNCAGLTDSLLESELFGHSKGAFTGATGDREGLFEVADKGTLFLDEIGDMPLNMQAKLLKVLEDGIVVPVGSNKQIKVNVRVISATHRDLKKMMEKNEFRNDLYFRIKVVALNIPALRERREDIPLLIEYFLKYYSEKQHKNIYRITNSANSLLLDYDWPGNVRELENSIKGAVTLCGGDEINIDHLPAEIKTSIRINQSHVNDHPDRSVINLFPSEELRSKARQYLDRYEKACSEIHDTKITQKAIAKQIDVTDKALIGIFKNYGEIMLAFFDAFPQGWPNLRNKTTIRRWCTKK